MQDEQQQAPDEAVQVHDMSESPAPGASIHLSDDCTPQDLLKAYHAAAAELSMRGTRELPVNETMAAMTDNRVLAISDNLYAIHGFDIGRASKSTLQRLHDLQTAPLPVTAQQGTYTMIHMDDGNGEDAGPSGVTVDDLLAIVQDQAERYSYIGRMGTVAGKVEDIRKILREATPM